MKEELTIGVIGGSGLYAMPDLTDRELLKVPTPFGDPSDSLVVGRLGGRRMVFLPRHGASHQILPSEINFRANIWALKKLGVSQILSVSAVGSMKETIEPGHLVLVDQFIDLTKRRVSSFFGEGAVVHVPMADPVCPSMHQLLVSVTAELGFESHARGTYVCVEGPQFSTRAESHVYRSWGVDVIGMTNMPEAKLAREAEIGYATIALATDYDCWHHSEASVTVEAVLETLAKNVEKARAVLRAYAARATPETLSEMARTALRTSLITPASAIPAELYQRLEPLFSPFLHRPKTSG